LIKKVPEIAVEVTHRPAVSVTQVRARGAHERVTVKPASAEDDKR
jgi:hypothetical protein